MQTVLITGGTGLVGSRLSLLLSENGYRVLHLSRKRNLQAAFPTYQWNIEKGTIDMEALQQADHIVHLAGAGVADERWTPRRKKEILESRVRSSALLKDGLEKIKKEPSAFIGASAIGIYGNHPTNEWLTETTPRGVGFLADVTAQWEATNASFAEAGIRTVLLRIGIVLSTQGGALAKMLPSYQFRTGAYFGDGSQYYAWIHLDDLCQLFLFALQNEDLQGVYNAVAPEPVPNKRLAYAIAEAMETPAVVLPAPALALRLALGEMASAVLDGARVSSEKIQRAGFEFQYGDLVPALKDLLKRSV